jgi:hypothetical protein
MGTREGVEKMMVKVTNALSTTELCAENITKQICRQCGNQKQWDNHKKSFHSQYFYSL